MLSILILTALFLLVPKAAFAWGPLTHMFLGSEVFLLGSVIPPAIFALINKYRQDFLYGNLMADMILGKKYLPVDKHPHNWDVAAGLLESAVNNHEQSFALGYMSHLAADTVAHGDYTAGARNFEHTMLELRADCVIGRDYWLEALALDGEVQRRGDAFLEGVMDMAVFSFKTNKRIFKSWVVISGMNLGMLPNTTGWGVNGYDNYGRLVGLHGESLERMADVLCNGTRSEVLKHDAIGEIKRGRFMNALMG